MVVVVRAATAVKGFPASEMSVRECLRTATAVGGSASSVEGRCGVKSRLFGGFAIRVSRSAI